MCITDAHLPNEDVEIKRISENSNDTDANTVFAALSGTKTAGERYISQAYKNGCRIVLTENSDGVEGYYIKTPNARAAYATMCAHLFSDPQDNMHCVGVTGTNGKTTVTYMLRHIFGTSGIPCGMLGSIENATPCRKMPTHLTTLDPPELYRALRDIYADGGKYVFMEASSHALALDKIYPIRYDVGILTNITSDHMDFHKNKENYISAKAKLFAQSKISLYNADDKNHETIERRVGGVYYTYSQYDKTSDFYFETEDMSESSMTVICHGQKLIVNSPARFNAYNATAAFAASVICGMSPDLASKAIRSFHMPKGRCETVSPDGAEFVVMIDFSHTPDSLANILRCGRDITKNRLTVVFGCGGDRDRTKRPEMGRIASLYADYAVITSDNSRGEDPDDIIRDILRGVDKNSRYEVISDRKQAIITALENARAGDCIILAGKGHEEYEINKEGKRYFSEREIVRCWFEGRYKNDGE